MSLKIDYDGEVFIITCPIWANDSIAHIEGKRWSKAKKHWRIGTARESVAILQSLSQQAGVETTTSARLAFEDSAKHVAELRGDGREFPSWYKFKRPPRKHQRKALDKGFSLRAMALHMEMQTGKSKVVIDLCSAHHMAGSVDAVLVITKRTLRRNWLERLDEDCPLPWHAILPDTGKEAMFHRFVKEGFKFPWVIIGWESLSAGKMADMIDAWFFNAGNVAVIGDETTYITNHKAARTERATKWGNNAVKVYTLAGAPALEGPMNLFAQYYFMDPDIVGIDNFYGFRNRYAVMGGYMREDPRTGQKKATEIVGYTKLDELMGKIGPFTFQFLKKDGYDLPPKRHQTRTVEITKLQRELYQEIKRDGTLTLKGSPSVVLENVLGVMLRQHQITGGYGVRPREVQSVGRDGTPKLKIVYDPVPLFKGKPEENPKMAEVMEVMSQFKGKKQCLLWAVYAPEIVDLVYLFNQAGWRVGELHGKIPDADRLPMINKFKDGNLDIIIGNAATGGMGYTMMNAEVNAFFNNTFRAIDRVQAEDRNWGEGQKNSPIVIDFVAEKTIDGIVMEALKSKQDLSEFVRTRINEVTRLLDGEL